MKIALAAASYFLLVFAAGFVFGPIRVLVLEPRVGPLAAILAEAPFLLLAMLISARQVIGWFAIPPGRPRLFVGAGAFGLLTVFEFAGAIVLRGMSPETYLLHLMTAPGVISLVLFALFAACPRLLARRT